MYSDDYIFDYMSDDDECEAEMADMQDAYDHEEHTTRLEDEI